jgi:hypothetical protein
LEVIHKPTKIRISRDFSQTYQSLEVSPFLDLYSLYEILMDRLRPDPHMAHIGWWRLEVDQRVLCGHGQILDYGIQDGSQVLLKNLIVGVLGPLQHMKKPEPAPNDGWDMGLAAGARIRQSIHKDPDPSVWDYKRTRVLNVQILNSVAFRAVTGLEIPSSPITPQLYLNYGIPFYSYLEERALNVTSVAAEIKSLGTIDAEIGPEKDTRVNPSKPTVCSKCGQRLCTMM